MKGERRFYRQKLMWIKMGLMALSLVGGFGLLFALMHGLVFAGPIAPPQGYPKFNISIKTVSPTLAYPGDVTLAYAIEIVNTGAYTATNVHVRDSLVDAMIYNDDAWASSGTVTVSDQVLTWMGDIGFDASVLLTFTVGLSSEFSGTVTNMAVISHPLLASPISKTAEAVITSNPIFVVAKSSSPAKPGPNKVLEYMLHVHNWGQPSENLPITVVDHVPVSTTLHDVGADGVASAANDVVTWTRNVTLALGESTVFTFRVQVDDVPPGTVVMNDQYYVDSPETNVAMGEPYPVTIVTPAFRLSKRVDPDPPGANREMTYKIKVLNVGSLATDLVITDRVPSRVIFGEGGVKVGDVVSWTLSRLDSYEDVEFSYSCSISDVMDIPIVNEDYAVCSAEGVCVSGPPLTSRVEGLNFEAIAIVDPIAKGPGGGGNKPVTPTLIARNVGPGNARDARAILSFYHISVSEADFYATPDIGTLEGPFDCSQDELKCSYFIWEGDLSYGEAITFTTYDGQSTIQPVPYTASIVITDSLLSLVGSLNLMMSTDPVTAIAGGKVTQQAYLLPTKSGPPVVGPGQIITYTINVKNTALATEASPAPYLVESLPTGTTFISASLGGTYRAMTVASMQLRVISWTLPALGTGGELDTPLWFSVRVDKGLVSGTHVVNSAYKTLWFETDGEVTGWISTTGKPMTTTVMDVGLIDSFKEVTPALASPGPGNVFTYIVHVVNSGPVPASGVKVYDYVPWQGATYNRDARASSGEVLSDIVSVQWLGDVAAYSEELITMTVLADATRVGPLTNTAVISHSSLLETVEVDAVAYVTDKPELRITKIPSPDPVKAGEELAYTLKVTNLGQKATDLVITDTIPANVTYEPGDAVVKWTLAALDSGKSATFNFRVTVDGGAAVVNDDYAVRCAEGVFAWGDAVVTQVIGGAQNIYLPVIMRQYP